MSEEATSCMIKRYHTLMRPIERFVPSVTKISYAPAFDKTVSEIRTEN